MAPFHDSKIFMIDYIYIYMQVWRLISFLIDLMKWKVKAMAIERMFQVKPLTRNLLHNQDWSILTNVNQV